MFDNLASEVRAVQAALPDIEIGVDAEGAPREAGQAGRWRAVRDVEQWHVQVMYLGGWADVAEAASLWGAAVVGDLFARLAEVR